MFREVCCECEGGTELYREGALWVSVRVHSQYMSEPCPAPLLQHACDVDGFDSCAQFFLHGVISDPLFGEKLVLAILM